MATTLDEETPMSVLPTGSNFMLFRLVAKSVRSPSLLYSFPGARRRQCTTSPASRYALSG